MMEWKGQDPKLVEPKGRSNGAKDGGRKAETLNRMTELTGQDPKSRKSKLVERKGGCLNGAKDSEGRQNTQTGTGSDDGGQDPKFRKPELVER